MATDDDADLIVSHALRSKDDLETALRIHAQFDEISRRVIAKFTDALVAFLRGTLAGPWQIESRSMFDRQEGIRIRNPVWPKDLWVELAADTEGGRNVYVGVRNLCMPALNEEIKGRLDELRRGTGGGQWAWYYYLRPPHTDWNSLDLLVRMYEGDTDLRDKVAREILVVMEVAGPLIDERTKGLQESH